jgi:hypothetical protein
MGNINSYITRAVTRMNTAFVSIPDDLDLKVKDCFRVSVLMLKIVTRIV